MNNLPQKGTIEYAMADVLSRPNTLNGLYQKLRLPLNYENLRKENPTYITHMADLADRVIQEAIDKGKDLNNQKVQEEIQAAFYGGATGASLALGYTRLLKFLGLRK